MNIWSIIIENKWSIIISVLIAIAIYFVQRHFRKETRQKLKDTENLFSKCSVKDNGDELYKIECKKPTEIQKDFLSKLNDYLRSNKGTADFSVIQNKTERFAKSVFEEASARISFPTYIGLMGTFAGVFLGLLLFLCNGFGSDDSVLGLIVGVLVSMSTSLCGLCMTTINNYIAANCKKNLDDSKNDFYDLLQTELLPHLGSNLIDALASLKDTLGNFEPAFNSCINNFSEKFGSSVDNFEGKFNACTEYFGTEFQENSKTLTNAVSAMGESIDKINANVENQQKLLDTIRATDMWETLENFCNAADKLKESTEGIESLSVIRKSLDESTEKLITAQEEYNKSLCIPKVLVEKTEKLLNRFETFENSVNNLGESIQNTDFINRYDIEEIDKHLKDIQKRTELAVNYSGIGNENLKKYYDDYNRELEELRDRYIDTIGEQKDKFTEMTNSISTAIEEKKKEFINILGEAFDVAEINTEFAHLKQLPEILAKIDEVKKLVVDKTQFDKQCGLLLENINNCNSTMKNNGDGENQNFNTLKEQISKIEQTFDAICTNTREIKQTVDNSKEQLTSEIENRVSELKSTFDSITHDVSRDTEAVKKDLNKLSKNISNLLETPTEHFDSGTKEQLEQLKNDISELIQEVEKCKNTKIDDGKKKLKEKQEKSLQSTNNPNPQLQQVRYARKWLGDVLKECAENEAQYKLTLSKDRQTADFEYCGNDSFCIANKEFIFDNVCDIRNNVSNAKSVKKEKLGKLQLMNDGKWKVTNKAVVKFC